MFDQPPNGSAYLGGMIRNKIIAEQNADDADRANDRARQWKRHAQALEAQLAQMQVTDQMQFAGMLAAQRALKAALKIVAPKHQLISDTGRRYKDGAVKDGARLIYEQSFDAKGVEMKIANPKSYRTD